MNVNQQNQIVAALGVAEFPATDTAVSFASQSGLIGLVPLPMLTEVIENVWSAGLLAVASGAVSGLSGITASAMLSQWQAGTVVVEEGYNSVSGSVSGNALWASLNA